MIVQIEHIEAINNLEKILSVKGVDGTIIGPYDLSGSIGVPGEFEMPDVQKTLVRYENVCQKMGKSMGFHIVQPDSEAANRYRGKGYTFLAVGVDMLYLGEKCGEVIGKIIR